jgi:Fe-Mn family superoxide dismutase
MFFSLKALPYDKSALEPYISSNTLSFHYDKHHKTYLDNLNNLIEKDTSYINLSLEEVILRSYKDNNIGVFNNAAQVWNHSFYWDCMSCNKVNEIPIELLSEIKSSFGTIENFRQLFKNAAITQFGSGWAWLVKGSDGKLDIMKTSNAENPNIKNYKPLLTIDVWEHAYYLDYQNKRVSYVDIFLDKLINWDFVLQELKN